VTTITNRPSDSSGELAEAESEMDQLLEKAKWLAKRHGSGFAQVMVIYIQETIKEHYAAKAKKEKFPPFRYLIFVERLFKDLKTLIKEERQFGHTQPNRVMREKYPDIFPL
jgi:hypothetical protein